MRILDKRLNTPARLALTLTLAWATRGKSRQAVTLFANGQLLAYVRTAMLPTV